VFIFRRIFIDEITAENDRGCAQGSKNSSLFSPIFWEMPGNAGGLGFAGCSAGLPTVLFFFLYL